MKLGKKLKGINPVGIASNYGNLFFVMGVIVLLFVAFFFVLGWIDPDFAWW